jgi:RNase P/RNase MRP subunit p30
MPKSQKEAIADARMKGALLYSSGYEFDDGVYKDLAKGNGALVFAFCDVLRESGFRRGIMISKMRLAFASCRKAGCGFVVCTMAKNENELRNDAELGAFMSVLGMNYHEKKFAGECAARLVER